MADRSKEALTVRPRFEEKKPERFISADGLRLDGRRPEQIRSIFMRTGVVSQARGSAYLEVDKTKVICAVYGPRQIEDSFSETGQLNCELSIAPFSSAARKKPRERASERELSDSLLQALETSVCLDKYPKSVIDVFVTALEIDDALSASITAASLALADAGIELFDLVASCTAAEMPERDVVVDPTALEEKYQVGGLMLAYMPSLNEITQLIQTGEMEHSKAVEATELCQDGCSKLHALMREYLIESSKQKSEGKEQIVSMEINA